MGQTSGEIKTYIDRKREQLGENISELQYRAKEAVDWKSKVRKRPLAAVGVAVGAGMVLSMFSWSRSSESERYEEAIPEVGPVPHNSRISPRLSNHSGQISDVFDNVLGALIGIAERKVTGYLEEVIPGFGEQYDRVSRKHSRPAA